MLILVVEDDPDVAAHVAMVLRGGGHKVIQAADGLKAIQVFAQAEFDVAVLDRMLPGTDGMSVLRALRAASPDTAVLMLTALGSIEHRVEGLEAGADDYLVKPFAGSELLARVNAVGRRRADGRMATMLTAGAIRVDVLRREAWVDGRHVALQPRELRLLEEVMRAEGRIVTRAMLLEAVWHFHFEPQTNIVESHMSRLRSKLALAGAKGVIETVRGEGYMLRAGS